MTDWIERLQEAGIEINGPMPPASDKMYTLVEVPFNSGTMVLARQVDRPFDDDSMSIIQSFSQILSFGYTRYEDLKKLEQQNQELRVGLAIDRVHVQVLAMERAQDWGLVLNIMRKEMIALVMKFTGCGINIIDEEAQRFRQHIICLQWLRKRLSPRFLRSHRRGDRLGT
jgi:hypothetical protein